MRQPFTAIAFSLSIMAPKRPRSAPPQMPRAIKVLLEHDVLNGTGCCSSAGGPVLYYKSNGLPYSCATKCAEYLLHAGEDERRKIVDVLCAGGATALNFAKLVTTYQDLLFNLKEQNTKKLKIGIQS